MTRPCLSHSACAAAALLAAPLSILAAEPEPAPAPDATGPRRPMTMAETAATPAPPPADPPLGTLGDGSPPESFFEALAKGKVDLDIRYRYEYADARGSDVSNANTVRTRLGYGTAPYNGLSFYIDFEDIRAFDDEAYDPNRIEPIPPRTFVSDPEGTELNQLYVKYVTDTLGFSFVGGRQRIILDDARFVGNVGWRQNEQTYDAIRVGTDLNIDGLDATYIYIWDVNRIFGDASQDGLTPAGSATRDFDSDSHLFHVSYDKLPIGKITGFAYLLDLERKGDGVEVFSTNTFGIRLAGKQDIKKDKLALGYNLSYAHQVDAAGNPRDLSADYYLAEGALHVDDVGVFTLGYEVLGADGTTQAFSTPLATLHKFQGFSDVLLGPSLTGGPIGAGAGIEDLYVGFSPSNLPLGLKGLVSYHRFETDAGGVDIGDEIDAVLSKKFKHNITVLAKYAHYVADDFATDTDRLWLEVTYKF